MGNEGVEQRMFTAIARRLNNGAVQTAFSLAAEGSPQIDLDQELGTLSQCIEKVNFLILNSAEIDSDFSGIQNTRRILNQWGHSQNDPTRIFNPFKTKDTSRPWLRDLLATIEIGNNEIGTTYRAPEKIRNGDPLSVFQWYLYDGTARMIAINLGIPNDKNKTQENESDLVACAFAEAAVILAEEGNSDARKVVQNMLDMEFIAKGWLLTDGLVDRARKVTEV